MELVHRELTEEVWDAAECIKMYKLDDIGHL